MQDQFLGGRYRLVRQLGEGGMGQVWEAQDETLGRPVAVKVISQLAGGGSRGDEVRARFLREARITARLQHQNIVTIHDLGESGTEGNRAPFLVMELVRGEGLDAKLRRGAVTLPDAARWGAQICEALADAHDAGIMHRDIKPSNILIMPSGTVKVLDFGIARAADPYATSDRLTQTGFIVGTPPYMAPEQARGFPEPRSDLYALGCLIFELITGRLPFQAPDTVGYLTAHLTEEPPTPSSVSSGIPSAWDDLVLRLLHKDPAQRYPNAADLSQALRQLDRALEPAPPADEPTPPATVPGTTPRPPAISNTAARELFATIKTNYGDILIKLFPNHAPKTVQNFVGLADGTRQWTDPRTGRPGQGPLYNGVIFHRVISGFMIQGGDPLGSGTGGPGYEFDDETHPDLLFTKPYLLAMANAGTRKRRGTNGSQFFITVAPATWLNRKHTIFGEVADAASQKVVDRIAAAPTRRQDDRPKQDVVISEIAIEKRTVLGTAARNP